MSYRRLRVEYNDSFKILNNLPRCVSARQAQIHDHLPTFDFLIRKFLYNFIHRCFKSNNLLVMALTQTDALYQSDYFLRLTRCYMWHRSKKVFCIFFVCVLFLYDMIFAA